MVIRLSLSFLFLLFSFQDGNIPLFAAVEAGNLHVCRELLLQETEAQLKYTKVCEKMSCEQFKIVVYICRYLHTGVLQGL